jgi:hypothetical protein
MRKDAQLVDVPPPDRDSPAWVKVGVIAAVGFVVGIAWPRIVGVRLGPSAPSSSSSATSSVAPVPVASEAPPASVPAKPTAVASAPPSAASSVAAAASGGPPQVSVPKGAIITCKTDDGDTKKGKECGSAAAIDALVLPRLKKLANCAASEGQTGKLSFVVTGDFTSGRLAWDIGKSSTVGNLDGMKTCLQTDFKGVSLASSAAHENPKYTVGYFATFSPPPEAKVEDPKTNAGAEAANPPPPPGDPSAKNDAPPQPASGEATVAWEVALVRDTPKTGSVVARLPRGAKVKLGSVKEGWYAIKYGDDFKSDGWVYRGAIGR